MDEDCCIFPMLHSLDPPTFGTRIVSTMNLYLFFEINACFINVTPCMIGSPLNGGETTIAVGFLFDAHNTNWWDAPLVL